MSDPTNTPDPVSIANLVIGGIKLISDVAQAVMQEVQRPGATSGSVIRSAKTVIDRALAIDADVDAVASGKV